jgi:hypothetical protein
MRAIALGVALASLLVAAPVAQAAVNKKCCYRVISTSAGQETANFGNDPSSRRIGTERFAWSFANREILTYVEQDGKPSFERPTSRRGEPAPAVTEGRFLEAVDTKDLQADGTSRGGEPCTAEAVVGRIHVEEGQPAVSFAEAKSTSLETQALFPRKPVLLQVVSPGLNATGQCGGLHGPPLPEGAHNTPNSNSPAGQAYWQQFVVPPPRSRLRHGEKHKRFAAKPYRLSLALDQNTHGCVPAGCQPHTMNGSITTKVTFSWFPRSQLAREVAKLKAYAAADNES